LVVVVIVESLNLALVPACVPFHFTDSAAEAV